MLRACRRVLKPGGRIAYYTIFISEDLPEDERRRAGSEAPVGVYTRRQQTVLLAAAGFERLQETDVTDEFHRVTRAIYEASARHARGLRRSLGAQRFEDDQKARQTALRRIERGIARRSLFVAERPARKRRSRPARPAR